jgi:hypothetical protein
MKKQLVMLSIIFVIFLAACRAPGNPVPVTRVRVTPTAVFPTPEANVVEVTRVVGTAEPTATPAPCTPLLEGMRLTITMAEQERTILLEVEGLLPEDKPIVLLNGRSPNHGSEIELTLANPVGPDGRYQDLFHLGENNIVNWSGQIIHQRGAICFEFIFPLTEPAVLAGTSPTPKPTTTPLPLPTPTVTPIPTTLATRTIETMATDCPIPDTLAQNELELVVPDCIVWLDNFDNETGFIVRLGYPRSGDWFLYYTPANVTAMHIPPEDAPRLIESAEQCQSRQEVVVEVTAVFLDHEQQVAGMMLQTECDLRQLPTATPVPPP